MYFAEVHLEFYIAKEKKIHRCVEDHQNITEQNED